MPTFFQPIWLLLFIPLGAACLAWPLPNRLLNALRVAVFVFVVFALAQLAIRLPDRAGTVIVVADRSESMPLDSDAVEKEIIALLHKSMGPRDQLGVVAFGRQAAVEQVPERGEFGGFAADIGPDHSSLNDGIQAALELIPPDGGGRILVLSDGKWTGKDPAAAAARAAGRGVAVDYRLVTRPQVDDTAIQSFLTPQSVLPGEAFLLNGWVSSPADQQITYQLKRNDLVISAGQKQVPQGLSRLMFRDRAATAGVNEYTLAIQGAKDDPVPENNTARALVGVEGARPVLVVSAAGDESGLVNLLRRGHVDVIGKAPNDCNWSLEGLSQYSAVILENVPAGDIGMDGMETIASWVEQTGSGLAMTGGEKSYGPGGYFKSPLERVLPISMEMRKEVRKMSVCVVVALDRSGSMAMPAGGGREKIDLADLGTVQVLDLLSPMDEFGVFAVDTTAHEIVPLDTIEHNESYRGKILSIDSEGGGIYIYEALVASAKMISNAKSETKHIILFSDAADAEQSAHYQDIVAKLREAGVTVSVVGLGTEHDCDANMLKDLAHRGGGDCYFSDNPDEIPRIFAQDTFTIARSTFVDHASPFSITAGYSLLGMAPAGAPPSLGGYNLCYLRPEANLAAVTRDEYKAPVVASWNAGNGRVLCYLGEADGKYSGNFAKWDQAGEFYSTLARWIAGKHQSLPDDMLLTQEIRDGDCFVELHLDPGRKADPFSNMPRVDVLHGLPGAAPAKETIPLQWKNADLLEADVPIEGRETVLNTVEIPGRQPVTLPPICLPYSPEFTPDEPGRGATALAQIGMTTGGKERVEIPKIWSELPVRSRYVSLTPWLLAVAAFLFLFEILERRAGWLSKLAGIKTALPAQTKSTEPKSPTPAFAPKAPQPVLNKSQTPAPVTVTAKAPQTKPAPAKSADDDGSTLGALRQARDRAKRKQTK
ncbi:MAG TPA: VWA domain-containing protein [Verrucomicrobiae bacterium]|jgi:Mg-chelatase subunit ChlD